MPPSASGPRGENPTTTGAATASTPGGTIRFSAALVAMSTQRSVSGSALPSSSPSISRNCRRISLIMSNAASPTAVMVMLLTRNGKIPPRNMPARTTGSLICSVNSGLLWVTVSIYAVMIASAASAAAPIANPLPIAAVVFPRASSESVIFRVSSPRPAISAIPPALSATGP